MFNLWNHKGIEGIAVLAGLVVLLGACMGKNVSASNEPWSLASAEPLAKPGPTAPPEAGKSRLKRDKLVLIKDDGIPNATIVYASPPPRPAGELSAQAELEHWAREYAWQDAQAAARELQTYLEKITGAKLPLVQESQPASGNSNLILVGNSGRLKDLGVNLEALSGDSFVIRVVSNTLVLAGVDKQLPLENVKKVNPQCSMKYGSRFAVNTFLEDFCGVRWFMPGEVGTDILPQKTLSVPSDLDRKYEASVKWRILGAPDWDWDLYNKLGCSMWIKTCGGHSWGLLVPPDRYWEKYPEFYALIDGKRQLTLYGNATLSLCTSNPEVLRIAVETVRRVFDEGYDMVQLGHPDGYGVGNGCECPECMKIGDTSRAGLAKRVYKFHLEIAEEVRKTHPRKYCQFLVYGPTATPPADFQGFPDNVIVELCDTSERGMKFWSPYVKSSTTYMYEWWDGNSEGYAPRASIRCILDKMDLFRRYHVIGAYWCGVPGQNWGLEGIQYWLAAKMHWNLNLDSKELLDDYYARFYRKAAPAMRAFFTLLDERQQVEVPRPGSSLDMYTARFTLEAVKKLDAHLAEAKRMAADDPVVLKRMDLTEQSLEYVKFTTALFRAYAGYMESQTTNTVEGIRKALEARTAFIDRLLAREKSGAYQDFTGRVFGVNREQLLAGGRPYGGAILDFGLNLNKIDAVLANTFEIPRAEIARAASPPVIDGKDTDECWQHAQPFRLVESNKAGPAGAATEAFMLRDAENFYVLFRCHEPQINELKSVSAKHDGDVWNEDCVEIFIRPLDTGRDYYHWIIGWTGATYDSFKGAAEDRSWEPKYQSKTSVDKERQVWMVEAAIPFAEVGGAPAPGATWRVNLCRERWTVQEFSAWSPTFGAFAAYERFGHMTFK